MPLTVHLILVGKENEYSIHVSKTETTLFKIQIKKERKLQIDINEKKKICFKMLTLQVC